MRPASPASTAALEGRGGGGIVTLATRDATIDWPQQLRAPIPVLRGDGRVEWQRFDTGIRLWLDDAFGDSGHGSARGKLRMVLRPGELPLLDLSATATDFDVTQTWRYLQTGRLPPKAIRWLDAAFRAGRVTTAKVSITGPTKGFPYREGQGVFRASGHASGINLLFASGWPELQGVESDFSFDGPALHAVASRGRIGGVEFTDAEINSADLRDAVFAARGTAATDAGRAIRMLQATPLAPSFGAAFAELAASGPGAADVTLFLPIKDFDRRVVTVQADLAGVTLRHRQQPFEATDIAGGLWVRNREIEAPALTGRALGGRWQASIATAVLGQRQPAHAGECRGQPAGGGAGAHRAHAVERRARGDDQLARLARRRTQRRRPAACARHGGAVRATCAASPRRCRSRSPRRPNPRARSRFPRASTAAPVPASKARFGRDVRALLQWRSRAGAPPVERGLVVFGGAAAESLPKNPGLWLTGRVESASLTRLLDLKWDGPRGRPIQEWLGGADLAVGRFEAVGYEFANVSGRLRPGNRAWDVTVTGDAIAGRVVVPFTFPGEVPMVLDLDTAALRCPRVRPRRASRSRPAQAAGDSRESRRPGFRPAPLRPGRGGVLARHGRHHAQPLHDGASGVQRRGPRQLARARQRRGVPARLRRRHEGRQGPHVRDAARQRRRGREGTGIGATHVAGTARGQRARASFRPAASSPPPTAS